MLAEMPWQIGVGVCSWASFYWSVLGAAQSAERRALIMLFIVQYYLYAATMAQMVVCAIPQPSVASMVAMLMFGLSFIFNGVMQPPNALPGFWIFMYRVSPFTYYISGVSSAALHDRPVQCSRHEMSIFDPPPGQDCGLYMKEFLSHAPGRLYNPYATHNCEYCPLSVADQYLAGRWISWDDRWRNYGIFWCYAVFNLFAAIVMYYVFRVRSMKAKVQLKGN